MHLSDEFILNQLHYYKNNLNSIPYHSRNLVHGLYMKYLSIARERGLIRQEDTMNKEKRMKKSN